MKSQIVIAALLSALSVPAFAGLNRPGFRRHLAAINYGLGGGGYEHEAVHR